MKITKISTIFKSILILLLMTAVATTQENSLVVDENGNVGIGTETPSARLEVDGDLKVSGHIKQGGDYSDWCVGSYYSIPTDQRTSWDWSTSDLTTTWTTVDYSTRLPQGVKRIRIYIDFKSIPNNRGRVIIRTRLPGSTEDNYARTGKALLQTEMTGKSRIGIEIEVDVADGKFEISEYASSWAVTELYINLRGFYI